MLQVLTRSLENGTNTGRLCELSVPAAARGEPCEQCVNEGEYGDAHEHPAKDRVRLLEKNPTNEQTSKQNRRECPPCELFNCSYPAIKSGSFDGELPALQHGAQFVHLLR